jgi:6-pyruvoyl-tetrahydropterin synthase
LRGEPDAQGMLLDLGHFTQALEQVRQKLDHQVCRLPLSSDYVPTSGTNCRVS